MIADFLKIQLHAITILMVDDIKQFLEFITYLCHLIARVGVEQDFLQQIVILVEHALGYTHVALEGSSWSILMLHDGSKDECADKRNTQ